MQINELLKLRGEKQSTLAKYMGVQQASISEWASGKKSPNIDRLIAMARYFHVSVGCIVGEEPIPENYPNHLQARHDKPIPAFVGETRISEDGTKTQYVPGDTPFGGGVLYVELPTSKPKEEPPFTKAQLSYIERMKKDIAAEVLEAIKEDTISSEKMATKGA